MASSSSSPSTTPPSNNTIEGIDLSRKSLLSLDIWLDSPLLILTVKNLNVARNSLTSCTGIDKLKQLQTLNLYYNRITTLKDLLPLQECSHLLSLDLRLNPVCRMNHYRHYLIKLLPSLITLDTRTITNDEREQSQAIVIDTTILEYNTDNNHSTPSQSKLRRLSNASNNNIDNNNDSPSSVSSLSSPSSSLPTLTTTSTTPPPSNSSPSSITGIATLTDGTLANIVLRRSEPSTRKSISKIHKNNESIPVTDENRDSTQTPLSSTVSKNETEYIATVATDNTRTQPIEKEETNNPNPVPSTIDSVSSSLSPVPSSDTLLPPPSLLLTSFPALPPAKDVIKQIPFDTDIVVYDTPHLPSSSSSSSSPSVPSFAVHHLPSSTLFSSPVIQAITAAPSYSASSTVLKDMLDSFTRSMENSVSSTVIGQYNNTKIENMIPLSSSSSSSSDTTTNHVQTVASSLPSATSADNENLPLPSTATVKSSHSRLLTNSYSSEQFVQHASARIALAARLQTPKKGSSPSVQTTLIGDNENKDEETEKNNNEKKTKSNQSSEASRQPTDESSSTTDTVAIPPMTHTNMIPDEDIDDMNHDDDNDSLRSRSPCLTATVTFPSASVPRVPEMLAAAERARSTGVMATLRPSSRGGIDMNESVVEECESMTMDNDNGDYIIPILSNFSSSKPLPNPSFSYRSSTIAEYHDSLSPDHHVQRPNPKKQEKAKSFRRTSVNSSSGSVSSSRTFTATTTLKNVPATVSSTSQENIHPSYPNSKYSSVRKNSTIQLPNRHSRLDLVLHDISSSIVPDSTTVNKNRTDVRSDASQEIIRVKNNHHHHHSDNILIPSKAGVPIDTSMNTNNNQAWQTFAAAQLELLQLMRNAHERIMKECDEAKYRVQISNQEKQSIQEQLDHSIKREQTLQEELEQLRKTNASLTVSLQTVQQQVREMEKNEHETQHAETQTDTTSCEHCDRWMKVCSTLRSRYDELAKECSLED